MKNYIKTLLSSFGVIMIIVIVSNILSFIGINSDTFYRMSLGAFIYLWVSENRFFK